MVLTRLKMLKNELLQKYCELWSLIELNRDISYEDQE